MKHRISRWLAVLGLVCEGGRFLLPGQTPSDAAVRVSAQIQTNPPNITLTWPADARCVTYNLARKLRDDPAWGTLVDLGPGVTSYVDTNVVLGEGYEYWISKWTVDTYVFAGDGYGYAGIEVPLVEWRGKAVLVVDSTFTASLSNELRRLQQDLVGDGWTVLRHDVPRMAVDPVNTSSSVWAARSNELASVKALIEADYNADSNNVKVGFLFGHVPVPYSGDLYPDAHSEHRGAWPADGFYGDMDGVWTDATINRSSASDPRNRNVPGDGKFDHTIWPGNGSGARKLELQVGRVDLANLPTFALDETELLRRYLNKDHDFRHKMISVERRGLIDDNLGWFLSEAPAANGWRNFAPFFGATNTVAVDWLTVPTSQSYLWGFGCGAGGSDYTSCSGVATASQLVTSDPPIVFTMLFGSYFGDWDSQNNLLRAAIATTNYTLTSAWVTRPSWHFHHMGLGEPIGFSTRVTQNNDGMLYSANGFQNFVHVALMGDPTLRMHVVAPPAELVAGTNASGNVELHWAPSPEAVVEYAVYRGPNGAGPFVRLNSALVTDTNYVDADITRCTYMVRAVKLEVSGSGSYYNASQGIFQDLDAPGAPQMLVVTARSASKVYGEALPALVAFYDGFVNGDTTNSLTSQAVLSTPVTASSPPGDYPIQVSGAAGTNYAVTFVDGTLKVLPATTTGLLTSSANPSLPGQEVTFTFTVGVVAPGAGTPTGTVQFNLDGMNAGTPVSLSGGVASYTNSALEHGWHWVQAVYAGDGNFKGVSAFLSPDQVVNTPPVAVPDTLECDATNEVTVGISLLLTNDWDADGDALFLDGVSAASVQGGGVVVSNEWVTYTPPPGVTNSDLFTYTISDGYAGPVTGTVTVTIRAGPGLPARLALSPLGPGSYVITGEGLSNRTYRFEFVEDLGNTNWQTLGVATADSSGSFRFTNSTVSTQRFYRSAYP